MAVEHLRAVHPALDAKTSLCKRPVYASNWKNPGPMAWRRGNTAVGALS